MFHAERLTYWWWWRGFWSSGLKYFSEGLTKKIVKRIHQKIVHKRLYQVIYYTLPVDEVKKVPPLISITSRVQFHQLQFVTTVWVHITVVYKKVKFFVSLEPVKLRVCLVIPRNWIRMTLTGRLKEEYFSSVHTFLLSSLVQLDF